MPINWFPGHMVKARREIEENMKLVDIVAMLLDARAPFSCRNADLERMSRKKKILLVLNKMDLAEPESTRRYLARLKEQGIRDHGQFIPENTINVGVIGTSNRQINVIPKDAFASLNVRCFTVAEQQRLDAAIKGMEGKTFVPGTRVTVTGGIKTGPMEKTEQVQRLVDLYKTIVRENYDAEVVEWVAGGLTDGNRSAKYVPTIDALGVENYDEHTNHESVDLNTAVPRTAALTLFMKETALRWPL